MAVHCGRAVEKFADAASFTNFKMIAMLAMIAMLLMIAMIATTAMIATIALCASTFQDGATPDLLSSNFAPTGCQQVLRQPIVSIVCLNWPSANFASTGRQHFSPQPVVSKFCLNRLSLDGIAVWIQ